MNFKKSKKDIGLIVAIVFAASVISGSVVFFAMTMGAGASEMPDVVLQEKIEQGIEAFVAKQEQKAKQQKADMEEGRKKENNEKAKNVPQVTSDDHIRGDVDAKVTLVEYSDFSCPFCARFHVTAKQILDEYEGEVNWVYRHYPLSFHNPGATNQAVASECVAELGGNEKFWLFTDKLYGDGVTSPEDLAKMSAGFGLSESAVLDCINSEKYLSKVEQSLQEGVASGVSGTPGNLLINNETGEIVLVEGAQPFQAFKSVIDGMLSN